MWRVTPGSKVIMRFTVDSKREYEREREKMEEREKR